MTIPDAKASGSLYTKTVIQGTGAKLTTSQSLLGDFALYVWSGKTHKLIGSTYSEGVPTLFTGTLLPGLQTALIGQKVGSRVLAVIPPKDAFGTAGNSSIGVGPNDTVVFVIDMLKSFDNSAGVSGTQTSDGGGALPTVTAGAAGKGPTITIPSTAAPKTLQVKTLIKGTGPVVKKGQYIVIQYTGVNWRTKKVFDSSWSRSEPFATVIGEGQVITGWDDRTGRPDRRQPRPARHPAGRRLRSERLHPSDRHQGHRHARLRGRHRGRLLTRFRRLRPARERGITLLAPATRLRPALRRGIRYPVVKRGSV